MTAVVIARHRFALFASVIVQEEASHALPKSLQQVVRRERQAHVCREGPQIFRQIHRMIIYYINDLSRIVEKIHTAHTEMESRSSGCPICVELRLAMTLR